MQVHEAAAFLDKLRGAAPPATAGSLTQLAALLQTLAEENAYLNALVAEGISADEQPPATEPAPAAPPPPPVEADVALTLLAGINDALRAPLVAVRGRAELVQAGLFGQLNEQQQQWVGAIEENTSRAFALLDAVQQSLALRGGQVNLDITRFIASDLTDEAQDRARDLLVTRRHTLTVTLPNTVPLALGDFYQSLIVLTALLDNAARYTPDGGEIRLSVDSLGTHALFSVADNGIGLAEEDHDRVAEPFWRAERHPLVRRHPGTGLSLFLARQVLALQEGELIFSGEPDTGSTFSFTLPAP